jgi:hypothetical protein
VFILCNSTITPSHKPTLFLFIDSCWLCLDLIWLSNGLLVRLISRCYVVPQCSTHPNHCLSCPVCRSRSSLLALFLLASRCFTGRSCRATVHILFSYICTRSSVIRLPSSPTILVGFLVTSVVSFDVLRPKKSLRRGSRTPLTRSHVSSTTSGCTYLIYYQTVVNVKNGTLLDDVACLWRMHYSSALGEWHVEFKIHNF